MVVSVSRFNPGSSCPRPAERAQEAARRDLVETFKKRVVLSQVLRRILAMSPLREAY